MNKRLFSLFSLGLLMLALLAAPGFIAEAQGGLMIYSVQPGVVSNTGPVALVVTGSGFLDGATVVVENYGALSTTFVSASVLNADLPAGLAPGSYTITIVNPDSNSISLANAVRVAEVVPTDNSPSGTDRPLLVIAKYDAGVENIAANQPIDLVIKLHNAGSLSAHNVLITFTQGDFIVRSSGGVQAVDEIEAGDSQRIEQPLTASWDVVNKSFASLTMQVAYNDDNGTAYTETFNLTVPVSAAKSQGPTRTPTPTATPVPVIRPQMVITKYDINTAVLQPGVQFTLRIQAQNVGNSPAKRLTMILGGGSSTSGLENGTPQPGGVAGGTGDFANFAPVASSNVQYLGDLEAGSNLDATATLIVNATTNPGAYPMKISFTYSSDNGTSYTDDQVVTLLVYSPPMVEVNFYRPVGEVYAGQMTQLPMQVVNLGRKPVVLSNMKVTASGGQLTNDSVLIGALDAGGYYPLDAMLTANAPGHLELLIRIDYTDDFNQPQFITRTLSLEVLDGGMLGPEGMPGEGLGPDGMPVNGMPGGSLGPDGMPIDGGLPGNEAGGPETTWQKFVRFLRGLFGLDSSQQTPSNGGVPMPEGPMPGEPMPGEKMPGG